MGALLETSFKLLQLRLSFPFLQELLHRHPLSSFDNLIRSVRDVVDIGQTGPPQPNDPADQSDSQVLISEDFLMTMIPCL